MSDPRRLFRTPIAIGMLCGALAGGFGILRLLVNMRGLIQSGFYIHYFLCFELIQLNLLIALPARIALGHWRFLVRLEVVLVVLVFGNYAFPYLMLLRAGGFNNYYYIYAWIFVTTLASGAILGRTLAVAYNCPDLRRAGTRWGAWGSLARFAVILGAFIFYRTGPESTAMIAMLSALAFIVQGVIAAVPFERAKKSDSESVASTLNDADGKE